MIPSYGRLSGVDIGVLAGYFALVILVGIFAMWKSNRGTVGGYFLAGRNMWFLPVGASLFVSNIGTEHFIGLTGSGAASGISVGAWEYNALLLLQLLGWVFLPVYIASGIYTMPEYLSKRFGGQRLRVYFAVVSLLIYILVKCAGDLFTGALFIQQSLNWDLYWSIVVLILLTALLTITGGLTAVIYTDTLQATLMLAGAIYLMIKAFEEVGGMEGLLERYPHAVPTNASAIVANTTCHWPDPQAFRMLRPVDDDYMPWLGFLLGGTPASIWYWCADQVIVQRALAARSLSHAQGATLFASVLKNIPIFIMVLPGMISRVLYPNEVACTNPDYCMEVCQSRAGCSNIAYPRLVLGLMPDGARGLMMAVMIAALMSDLDSIFNSSSTVFTMDIYRRFRKAASTTELMVVGRLCVIVMVAVAVSWVPIIKETSGGQVFIYFVETSNYLVPPFAAIFLVGVLVPRVNEKGAFWALILAFMVGGARLVVMFIYQSEDYCGWEGDLPAFLKKFHYMYFSVFLSLLTAVTAIVVSLLTEPPHPNLLRGTTYWTRHSSPLTEDDLHPEQDAQDCVVTDKDGHLALPLHPVPLGEGEGQGGIGEEKDGDAGVAMNGAPESDCSGADVMTEKAAYQKDGPRDIRAVLLSLVCGVRKDGQDVEEQLRTMETHLRDLGATRQDPVTRTLLALGMAAAVALGLAMYLFWSLYDFHTAPFYPRGAHTLLPGDAELLEKLGNATG